MKWISLPIRLNCGRKRDPIVIFHGTPIKYIYLFFYFYGTETARLVMLAETDGRRSGLKYEHITWPNSIQSAAAKCDNQLYIFLFCQACLMSSVKSDTKWATKMKAFSMRILLTAPLLFTGGRKDDLIKITW